jgi:hypothetical protein
MTSFLSLLREKDRLDEIIDLCGDWYGSGRNANFFLTFLASAYCTKGRSATPSFGDKDTLRTQCEWFTVSLDYLEEAWKDLSAFDRQVVKQTFFSIRDISGFIKQSACLGINLPYLFLDRSLQFFEDYWSDSFRRIQTDKNSNVDISSGVTESILGIFFELRQILEQVEGDVKGKSVEVDLSSMKWAQTRISALSIVRFAGFENSLAVMADPATGKTFSLHCTTYNDAYSNNPNLPEWSSLAVDEVVHCVVFKYYITRESKRDRVRSVVAGSG